MRLSGQLVLCVIVLLFFAGCTATSPGKGDRRGAERLWGSERVCLPCHVYQEPIARNHHYRCDTCHNGNPWAETEDEAHYEMIANPQAPQNMSKTCDQCHRRVLGHDVPYDAEFIKAVIVSHKRAQGESLEWQD